MIQNSLYTIKNYTNRFQGKMNMGWGERQWDDRNNIIRQRLLLKSSLFFWMMIIRYLFNLKIIMASVLSFMLTTVNLRIYSVGTRERNAREKREGHSWPCLVVIIVPLEGEETGRPHGSAGVTCSIWREPGVLRLPVNFQLRRATAK